MLKLLAKTTECWDGEPVVLRVVESPDIQQELRPESALLFSDGPPAVAGFGAYLVRSPAGSRVPTTTTRSIPLPHSLSYLAAGDIVRLNPRSGEIWVMYRRGSPSNSMLLTEQCNSFCLMCSQPPKEPADRHLVDAYLQAIPLMDPATAELGVTGGEPTLLGDDFLAVVASCKQHLPTTALHILSNGRLFNYLSFAKALSDIGHPDLVVGIPLYSDLAYLHDFVVQAPGAFDQTLRGIMNLERCGVRVELRVVLHRQTVARLPQLARFVARNLPFADHVALMGIELMGFVRMNLEALWIDPADYQVELGIAVETLSAAGLTVSIYNHQLCTLDQSLWPFARKSISDWKNEYADECEGCAVRDECGGFFSSAEVRRPKGIRAFQHQELRKTETCSFID
jgi:His-Xaa-Ser system radical SAM maturase HxsC